MSQRVTRAGLASIAVTALVLAGASSPVWAATPAMTLSSVTGPSGGGTIITGTVASPFVVFPAGTTPAVQFQYVGTGSTTCSATAGAVAQIAVTGTTGTDGVQTVDPDQVRRVSATKVLFTVPSQAYPVIGEDGYPSTINPTGVVLAGAQTWAKWNVCVYDTDSTVSSTLLATASYTVTARPTITSIIPASSPAGGGQSITVNGTGFSAVTTATTGAIGDVPLVDIKVAPNGNSLTATTGPRASGTGLALTLTTPGGTVSSLDPDNNDQPEDADPDTDDAPIGFLYSNGITIAPRTAPAGTTVVVDVNGAGFSGLSFSAAGDPQSTQAHVFLVRDAYVLDSNRGVAECVVQAVIGDTELICTLDLSADQLSLTDSSTLPSTPITDGAYFLTVVADGSTTALNPNSSIVSSGAAFIVAPY
ncbi:IPT/TIG domain-containing protein [Actinoplanes awajinensis]|uniref:IPT/TIG domain-containing protein n=1 Tax=Actinoplanes awajinensis TaxID=135946 RepID=UPI0009FCD3FD|nr:IPT/TIG domain-containing protein [Actinoplanes awajinensis]